MRLDARSRRPGLAHEEFNLCLDLPHAERACHMAAAEGLPLPLWVVIAIESQRALRAARPDESPGAVASRLDWAARRPPRQVRRATRLAAYAAVLRCPPRTVQPMRVASELPLLVPYHTFLAWEIAAEDDEVALNDWALAQLAAAGTRRPLWEAASAEAGQMLAEWVALQARARGLAS
jgi:hypothetical protein